MGSQVAVNQESEFPKDLDLKSRVDKLDSFLLFLSSSSGLVFGVIQSFIKGLESLVLIVPLFFLGWFFPIYVGYVRGAIILGSIPERLRGWLYLLVSIPVYVGFGMLILLDPIKRLETILDVSKLWILDSILIFLLALLSVGVGEHLFGVLCRALNLKSTQEFKKAYLFTRKSAVSLSLVASSVLLFEYLPSEARSEFVLLLTFLVLPAGSLAVVVNERRARHWITQMDKPQSTSSTR